MTVRELIEALGRLPQDMRVVTDYDGAACDVQRPREVVVGDEFTRLRGQLDLSEHVVTLG